MCADAPLWLVIEQDGIVVRSFELRAHHHRAFAIGSAKEAALRIEGAPPIAFFVERDGDKIWLTPAYADSDLRVDNKRVRARCQLLWTSVVEFATVRLVLRTRDTPPTLRGDNIARARSETDELDEAFAQFEPGYQQSVTAEVGRSSVMSSLRDPPTAEYSRGELLPFDAYPTKTTEMLRTDLESLFAFDDTINEASIRTTQRLFASASVASEPLAGASEVPCDCVTDRPMILLKPEATQVSSLARLGILTKQRPVAVVVGATLGALVLAIFLVGVSQVAGMRPQPSSGATSSLAVASQPTTGSAPVKAECDASVATGVAQPSVENPIQNDAAVVPPVPRATPRRPRRALK